VFHYLLISNCVVKFAFLFSVICGFVVLIKRFKQKILRGFRNNIRK